MQHDLRDAGLNLVGEVSHRFFPLLRFAVPLLGEPLPDRPRIDVRFPDEPFG